MSKRVRSNDNEEMFVFSKQDLQDLISKTVQQELKKIRKNDEVPLGPNIEFINFDNSTNRAETTYQHGTCEFTPEIVLSSDDESTQDMKFNILPENQIFGELLHGPPFVNSNDKGLLSIGSTSSTEPTLQMILDNIVQLQKSVAKVNLKVTHLENLMTKRDTKISPDHYDKIVSNLNPLFPLKTLEEFQNVESQLKDQIFYDEMVNFCRMIGGSNGKQHTFRAYNRFFTNELATKFSWQGRLKNEPLKDKLLVRAIGESIISIYTNFTEYDYKKWTADWFRFANIRVIRNSTKHT